MNSWMNSTQTPRPGKGRRRLRRKLALPAQRRAAAIHDEWQGQLKDSNSVFFELESVLSGGPVRFWLAMVLMLSMLWGGLAFAAKNPALSNHQDERARRLEYGLRCVMCQSESIADSQSQVAKAMRRQVRRMVAEGKTDAEIKRFFVASYGEFVLMEPENKPTNWPLWFGPLVMLLGGAGLVLSQFRKKQRLAVAAVVAQSPESTPPPVDGPLQKQMDEARRLLEEKP